MASAVVKEVIIVDERSSDRMHGHTDAISSNDPVSETSVPLRSTISIVSRRLHDITPKDSSWWKGET